MVFKLQSEKHGDLHYVRVYSGVLGARSRVFNANLGKMEHVTHLYRMHANAREQVKEAGPGDIVAASGLKFSVTGDTLCDRRKPIVYERMRVPETVISMAIEPRTQAEKKKLDDALDRLAREDPTFVRAIDSQTGQLLISGMGELHLEIIRGRLLREFNVDARVGEPRVSFRESLTSAITIDETFRKELEGHGQFARVVIAFEPAPCGSVLEFENRVPKDVLADHFVRAVRRSLTQISSGVLYGYPLINIRAVLQDASSHPVDSTELAFEAAATMAQRRALDEGGCTLYEPYMRLEVVTPEDNLGDVINFISGCRGAVQEVIAREQVRALRAEAPLRELFGFATRLRSLTQGRGTYSMEPLAYRPAPTDILEFG